MRVSVGQFRPTGDLEENLGMIAELAARAAADSSELLILPEESMFTVGKVSGELADAVAAGWPRFMAALAQIARENGLAIIAGGYEPSGDHRPFNTLVAINNDGDTLGTYRKLHLYDAFSYQESTKIRPGDGGTTVVPVGDLKVGLMTCYDLRFPEMARALADSGAELVAVPAAWFKGENKIDHWETLLKARAIENTVWVAAAGTASGHTIGHSAILDPLGIPVDFLDEEVGEIVTVDVTGQKIADVRSFLPVLANRRFAPNSQIS